MCTSRASITRHPPIYIQTEESTKAEQEIVATIYGV
jgi:hypothetical protein